MKKALTILLMLPFMAFAQVPRKVVIEQFTNTYCSICASRNPGFYTNLARFPQVQHISYYPSSPYPTCPINLQNKPENDSRTNYYGIYGATPRLVIQGAVIPSSANYADSSLIAGYLSGTSPYKLTVNITPAGSRWNVATTIKAVTTTSSDSQSLYVAFIQDTLLFSAANGETRHYDVFRHTVGSATPARVRVPVTAGDSVIVTYTADADAAWDLSTIYAVAILSDNSKTILQSERSANIRMTTGIASANPLTNAIIFPNPVENTLYVHGWPQGTKVSIVNMAGQLVQEQQVEDAVDVTALKPGIYNAIFTSDNLSVNRIIVKK